MYICLTKVLQMSYGSNLEKIQTDTPIQSYKDVFDFIYEWLPARYSNEVVQMLDDKVDPAYVRQVKRERIRNPKIINALYRLAQYNKYQIETN